MLRQLALVYGLISYLIFLGSFVYAIGFVGNLIVPKSIDAPPVVASWARALVQDAALLLLFAVPHSIMARPSFKTWWARFIPSHLERSTYVLQSSVLLLLLFWLWIPMPAVIWELNVQAVRATVWAFYCFGWSLALVATFLINHFDLFGLRQVYLFWANRAYEPIDFRMPILYRWVRHPLVLGFLIAFWAAPTMTVGRLVFALATTVYCLIALRLEERDLLNFHGENYRNYQQKVGMLLPAPRNARKSPVP